MRRETPVAALPRQAGIRGVLRQSGDWPSQRLRGASALNPADDFAEKIGDYGPDGGKDSDADSETRANGLELGDATPDSEGSPGCMGRWRRQNPLAMAGRSQR